MQQTIRCFIVDDEAPAHVLLEKYIKRVPYLELVGQVYDAVEALFAIEQAKPDLIFLDIEMPEMTGIEFLKALPAHRPDFSRPAVVMVTAYSEYAVQGFEHDVLDYLLKPAPFERFMQAINKFKARQGITTSNVLSPDSSPGLPASEPVIKPIAESESTETAGQKGNFFLVKEDKKLIRVAPADILFVESDSDYLTIHLADRTILTYMTMGKLETMLPAEEFLRVNRSYIIRLGAIKEIDGNLITTLNGKRVPIGVTYRDRVMEVLKRMMR
ncbi:LytR/AlgR family response regulator transcription factor [Rudanella lutea]|uniref:LytR/AlgR family response regulator transcription factor n=1 Tax=Rudanella lutea TaxID=451374 RepID=UPI0003662917|nr:LytTR family DNA-binding domain-containing protein [Rudanella lutea]